MNQTVTSIKFAGPAGLGIKSIGLLLSKILIDHGFFVNDYSEYPSLVRGGHNTYQLSFSPDPIYAPFYQLDYIFSISPKHWLPHQDELKAKGLIFSEEADPVDTKNFINIPLKSLAQESGSSLTINTIALGIFGYIFGFDNNIVQRNLSAQYPKAADVNQKAYHLGFEYASKNLSSYQNKLAKGNNKSSRCLHDGNEAFGWGFLKGGGNFYAAYPMTPATGTLHFLAGKQLDTPGLTVVHPEDEIAAANMVLGASFAGARAATGTSGGGFALMNEAISFAAIAEIGAVYYLVSRPGPATGLPTWTSQGDLLHAIFSGHGEFPLIVLAPGDQQESFEMGREAINLAVLLQTPVIVVSDKFAAESASSVTDLSAEKEQVGSPKLSTNTGSDFKRYDTESPDGISTMSYPGTQDNEYLTNSYEHDDYGFSTEDGQTTIASVDKRFRKLKTALSITPKAEIYGNEKARTLIVSFGSTKGPILEAIRNMDNPDDYAFLQIKTVWPIDQNLKYIIDSFKQIIVIENDKTAQLSTLIKSQYDFNPDHIITKYDGRPFYPEELATKLSEIRDNSKEVISLKIEN